MDTKVVDMQKMMQAGHQYVHLKRPGYVLFFVYDSRCVSLCVSEGARVRRPLRNARRMNTHTHTHTPRARAPRRSCECLRSLAPLFMHAASPSTDACRLDFLFGCGPFFAAREPVVLAVLRDDLTSRFLLLPRCMGHV